MNRSLRFAFIILFSPAVAAAPPSDLDSYVAKTMEAFGNPGMSVAVVENGETVVAKGYGLRRMESGKRADEHTIFPIGSCTKAFVAAALAILVEDGKLGWDDKVIDHMPWFRMYDPFTTAEMTIRDLLVHRSGLPLGAGDLLWLGGSDYTRKGLIERLRYIKPATSFRSRYAYDNVLYVAAGQLVEEVSGMSWEDFTEKRLFKPLGMKDSTVAPGDAVKNRNHALLHARLQGELRGLGPLEVLPDKGTVTVDANVAPAGSIYASAVDMAKWMKAQLALGAISDDKRLWSERTGREMWRGVVPTPSGGSLPGLEKLTPNFSLYALGWGERDYQGHRIITHSGGVFGGAAVVILVPEKNVGIAVMINSEDGAARRVVSYRLLDHYLGLPEEDWIGNYQKALEAMFKMGLEGLRSLPPDAGSGPGPSLPLEKYAGKYEDAWYGGMTITHSGKGLHLQFDRTKALNSPLQHVRYDTFRTSFPDRNLEDAYVTFSLNPDGSIDQVKMKAVSPLADFSFNYHDLLFRPKK